MIRLPPAYETRFINREGLEGPRNKWYAWNRDGWTLEELWSHTARGDFDDRGIEVRWH